MALLVRGHRQGTHFMLFGGREVVNGKIADADRDELEAMGYTLVAHRWREPLPTDDEAREIAGARERTQRDIGRMMRDVFAPLTKKFHVQGEFRRR